MSQQKTLSLKFSNGRDFPMSITFFKNVWNFWIRSQLLNSLAKITVVGNMEPMCVLIFSAVLIASFFTNLLYFIFFHFFLFFQQPRFIKCELPHKENFSLLEKKTNHVLVVTAHTSNVYFFLSHNPNFIWQLTTDVTRVQFWWPWVSL